MFIDIRKCPEGHSQFDTELTFSEEFQEAGNIVTKEFPASISIDRYGDYLFVEVSYSIEVNRECARCLKAIVKSSWGSVKFTLQSDKSEDMSSDDVDTYTYQTEDEEIDFTQSLYDHAMTRLHSKPLCSLSCEGFVKYLPQEEVEEPQELDPRWAALKNLK